MTALEVRSQVDEAYAVRILDALDPDPPTCPSTPMTASTWPHAADGGLLQ